MHETNDCLNLTLSNFMHNESAVMYHFFSKKYVNTHFLTDVLAILLLVQISKMEKRVYIVLDLLCTQEDEAYIRLMLNELCGCRRIELISSEGVYKQIDAVSLSKYLSETKLFDCMSLGNSKLGFYEKCRSIMFQLERDHLNANHIIYQNLNDLYKENDIILPFSMFESKKDKYIEDVNPDKLFLKLMSAKDQFMFSIYRLILDNRVINCDNNAWKPKIASFIISELYCSESIADKAHDKFVRLHKQNKYHESDFYVINVDKGCTVFEAIYNKEFFGSKSNLKRIFIQNGIKGIDGEIYTLTDVVKKTIYIKAGKKYLLKVEVDDYEKKGSCNFEFN